MFLQAKRLDDRLFGTLLFIYILIDVYYSGSFPVRAHFFGLMIFGAAFIKKIVVEKESFFINPAVGFYLFFVFWAVISFFWAANEDFYYDRLQRILFCAIFVFCFYNILRYFNISVYFLLSIVMSGFLSILVFYELIPNPMSNLSFEEITSRYSGTTGNANTFAVLMSFSLFSTSLLITFFIKKTNVYLRLLLFFNIPVSIYIIVQTGSRKGIMIALSFLFLFFLPYIKSTKGIFAGVIFVAILSATLGYMMNDDEFAEQLGFVSKRFEKAQETIEGTGVEESTQHRLQLIDQGVDVWMKNPIIGVGLNNFSFYSGGSYAHNNFLEIAVNFGVIGFVLFYLFFIFCFYSVFKIADNNLRMQCIIFLFIILVSDYASVSYYSLPYLMMLVFVSSIAKSNLKKNFSLVNQK